MIKLKKRFDDFRLYDTKTGQFVPFNAENRSRALFCMIARNEAKKPGNNPEELYTIEELANIYGGLLYEFRTVEKTEKVNYEAFLYMLNRKFGLEKLLESKNFQKLALCVLFDQDDEYTQTNIYDVETLKRDYGYYNDKIFKREEEKQL